MIFEQVFFDICEKFVISQFQIFHLLKIVFWILQTLLLHWFIQVNLFFSNIVSVVVPSTVRFYNTDGFAYCEVLERVEINSPITLFGLNHFRGCFTLQEIFIGGVQVFKDGVLDLRQSTVGYVDPGAFYGVLTIQTICVYTGIVFQMRAFENCRGLKKVIVYSAGQFENFTQVFYNCNNLRAVQFEQGVSCSDFSAAKFSIVFGGSSLVLRNGWCDLDDRDPPSSFESGESVLSDPFFNTSNQDEDSSGMSRGIIALIVILIIVVIITIAVITFFIFRRSSVPSPLNTPLINFSTESRDF